jgi:hypothetical protein
MSHEEALACEALAVMRGPVTISILNPYGASVRACFD